MKDLLPQFVYAIHTVSDPNTYYYVGRSKDPRGRLRQHINEIGWGTTEKCIVLNQLMEDGEELTYTVLASGYTIDEELWVINMLGAGHPLTNSKGGDEKVEFFDIDLNKPTTPWAVELFTEAKWEKDLPRAKKSEVSTTIKGIQFFRSGKSKMRFIHPDKGEWDVRGWDLDKMYECAVQMLTSGTEKNKQWLEHYKTAKSLRPSMY